jgi:fructose-specific phosphotransferase system IIC component
MTGKRRSRSMMYGLVLASLLLASCARAPSFDVLGSFFPAWLVCLIAAILLTVLARWIFLSLRLPLAPPILIYPSLTALFAFALWLIFFR